MSITKSGHIEPLLSHLVDIRASQLNGCAFCLDMHVKEAKLYGERAAPVPYRYLARVPAVYTQGTHRTGLTEALTQIASTGIGDELYAEMRE